MEKLYTLPKLAEMRGHSYETLDTWAKDKILEVVLSSAKKQPRRSATITAVLRAEAEIKRKANEPKQPKVKKQKSTPNQTPEEYFKGFGIII
jgi:hypothetical protein